MIDMGRLLMLLGGVLLLTAQLDMPTPAPDRGAARARLSQNEGCVRCHQDIAAEWDASAHKSAYSDHYFQRSLALEPQAFCRGCHAPEASPQKDAPPHLAEIGVACVSCHVIDGRIVSTRGYAKTGADDHDVIGDPRWAKSDVCAGCHQFPFPSNPDLAMQRTMSEHASSSASGESCQSCHMKKGAGNRMGHGFVVDRALLGEAVEIDVALGPAGLSVTLAPGRIGHAFPTGDMHRQVELRAWALDARGRRSSPVVRHALGRHFSVRDGRRREISDTRLPAPGTPGFAGQQEIEMPLKGHAKAKWQLVWQRFPPRLEGSLKMRAAHHEIVIDEGVVERQRAH